MTPPLVDMDDRVPVTAADEARDDRPASALLMPAQAAAIWTRPGNCNRTLPVFDGATRFNVVLSYAETRRREAGLSGPVLVCNARYSGGGRPSAGPAGGAFMEGEPRHVGLARAVEGARMWCRSGFGAHHGRHQHHRGDPLGADHGAAYLRPKGRRRAPPGSLASSLRRRAASRAGSSSFEF